MTPPRRFIIRYRKKPTDKWKRFPRFITPITGYRTAAAAQTKLDQLRRDGYAGHIASVDWLRILALAEARKLIGVMEHGANNRGTKVDEITRENGGTLGEPWCGNFCAYVYRRAGSKAVTRSWAAVRLLGGIAGLRVVGKRKGAPGDLVRFTFDHVGILEGYCNSQGHNRSAVTATHIRAIEGNTGRTGAVSDSRTGGDGVYRKIRPLNLVQDCVVVLR